MLRPESLPEPDGPFSQGTTISRGRLVFVSGQVAWDKERKVVGKRDVQAQTAQALENLKGVLAEGGATLEDVVKVTVFLTNMADRGAVAEVRTRYFQREFPASTLVEVKALAHPDLLVEIEAIAVVPQG